ncbi:MAG: LysR family transcriptional regulator [Betaproteobacteria bacterium]|nr:LysR family transcriptional regulator [Betaproteobacteria bacterium]
MKLQLRDIEYFSVVAEHGNVGRAAEALGLSQPALSKSLHRLEQSMQAKLVKRTAKGMELTTVGAALFSHVRRLRLSLDDVTREVADLSQGRAGHLRIGIAPGFAIHLVPDACATLLKEAPRVTFKVTVLDREASLAALRHGELDLALTTLQAPRHEDLVEEYLLEDEFVVYASADHRLAKKRRVTLADLAQERWAVAASNAPTPQRFKQVFLDAGLPPPGITMESNSLPLRNRLLASSDLLGFAAKRVVRQATPRSRFVELRVRDLAYSRCVGVMYRKDAYLSPAARRFIEILQTTAKEIAREP